MDPEQTIKKWIRFLGFKQLGRHFLWNFAFQSVYYDSLFSFNIWVNLFFWIRTGSFICHAKTDHNEDHKNAGSMILLIPGDHVAVDRNAGAAVEVDARTVAAAQVAEHVAAARLQRGRPYQD